MRPCPRAPPATARRRRPASSRNASAAALMGCPGSQVTPTRETCPKEAVRAAQKRTLKQDADFIVHVDARQPCPEREACDVTVRDGSIETVVKEGRYGMPDGTRLYGQAFTAVDKVVI